MNTPSVETDHPPGQAELVPDEQNLMAEWCADGVAFELWVHRGTGFILADPQRSFEVVAHVEINGDQMAVVWRGSLTERPRPWLNAQRARAERLYFHPEERR